MKNKNCFIIMPFSKVVGKDSDNLIKTDLDFIYEEVISKAIREYEFQGKRIFKSISRFNQKTGSIIKGITSELNSADLVIADLSGLNPNVMYELGVRHSLKRGTIIISQDVDSLPSDLRDYMCVEYSYSSVTTIQKSNYEKFKIELHHAIEEFISTEKMDSPVLTYLGEKNRNWREDELKKLREDFVVTGYIFDKFHELVDIVEKVNKDQSHDITLNAFYGVLFSLIDNLGSAIGDLRLGMDDPQIYERRKAASSLFDSLRRNLFITDYLGTISTMTSPGEATPFTGLKKDLFQTRHLDFFALEKGEIVDLSFEEIFKEDSILMSQFLDPLDDYIEKQAKELGLPKKEINALFKYHSTDKYK